MLYVHLLSVLPVVINTGMSIWSLEMFGCLRSSALALAHGTGLRACACRARLLAPLQPCRVSPIPVGCLGYAFFGK